MRGSWVLLALGACGDDAVTKTDSGIADCPVDDYVRAADTTTYTTLAETGLCLDAGGTQIATGIREYAPRFELYSDTATEKRWIYLPPGTQIDTSNMDFWQFPAGNKLWKELARGGTRVETRLVWRRSACGTSEDWHYAAYVWNATHYAEFGEADANGTPHDVPGKALCRQCHETVKPSRVHGISAIQLDFDGVGTQFDLDYLITMSLLSAPPRVRIAIACSKGTYVRSLIADLGTDLGCGAHMTELRRTRSGVFTLALAHDLDRLDNYTLVPMEQATRLPRVVAAAELVTKIRNGLQMPPDALGVRPEDYERFQLLDPAGQLVAVGHVEGNKVLYDRVFVS